MSSIRQVVPADFSRYCGYEPRRSYVDETFPFGSARVHVFRQGEASGRPNAAAAAADKTSGREAAASDLNHEQPAEGGPETFGPHLQSKLAEMLFSRALTGGHQQHLSPAAIVSSSRTMVTSEALAPHTATSATARGLLRALRAFEAACQEATSPLPDDNRVVQLLAGALSERGGELVVQWESAETEGSVYKCVQRVLSACLYAGCFPAVQGKPAEQLWEEIASFLDLYSFGDLLELSVLRQIGAPSGMHGGLWVAAALPEKTRNQLAAALFCTASTLAADNNDLLLLLFDIEPERAQLDIARLAYSMGIEDSRLWKLAARLHTFVLERLDDAEPETNKAGEKASCSELIAACCDEVLRMEPEDTEATFTKAFALGNHPDTARHAPEAMLLYGRYLQAAEPDDCFRAAAHYHLGLLSVQQHIMSISEKGQMPIGHAEMSEEAESAFVMARKEYLQGLAAEEKRLPFLQPQGVPSKELLGLVLLCVKGKGDEARARRAAASVAHTQQEEAAAKARKAQRKARTTARKQQEAKARKEKKHKARKAKRKELLARMHQVYS